MKLLNIRMISHFYPRSPCGERLRQVDRVSITRRISIHALLAESDVVKKAITFYPPVISIHALLAESDQQGRNGQNIERNFYPRSPCGERRFFNAYCSQCSDYFYPRSPCGERRPLIFNVQPRKTISIHALLAESDRTQSASLSE